MAWQHVEIDQQCISRDKTHQGKSGNGHGRSHRIQSIPTHRDAVSRPTKSRRYEQKVANPNIATFKGFEQTHPTHQNVAAHNHAKANGSVQANLLTQNEPHQQTGPERQTAGHEHRGMACRRIKKAKVGQHRIQETTRHASLYRDVQRQRRQTPQRTHFFAALSGFAHEPPSPRQ